MVNSEPGDPRLRHGIVASTLAQITSSFFRDLDGSNIICQCRCLGRRTTVAGMYNRLDTDFVTLRPVASATSISVDEAT